MKEFRSSITDYTAALKVDPTQASSLYGRAMAEQALGLPAAGDIAAAKQNDPNVVSDFGT
jgi:hypothetical protein